MLNLQPLVPLVLALGVLSSRLAFAAAVPGGQLSLSRSTAAASCPDEEAIGKELRARLVARPEQRGVLSLQVKLDAQGSIFKADIQVAGQKQGERSLRAEGPGCAALHDVLLVSLLLLLDEDSDWTLPAKQKARRGIASASSPATVWLTSGGALTHGLPHGWSSAWYGELGLRLGSWEVALGGLWTPDRSVDFPPGMVVIQMFAARARGCYAVEASDLRFSGCMFSMLATLRGRGENFTSNEAQRRAWLLVGAGPELSWAPLRSFSLGISGQLLASTHDETFSIHGLPGPAYRSDRWLSWFGFEFGVLIW